MARALLYLDENLASSIALRYIDYLSTMIQLTPFIIHVVVPEEKEQAGTGWVRRTWESGMIESGKATISRLLKTEKVKCAFGSTPKIKIGNKDDEILEELRITSYDFFAEGHLPTSRSQDFHDLLDSELYIKAPCSIMCIKNLSVSKTVGILLGNGVEPETVVSELKKIWDNSVMNIDLIYYTFKDSDNLEFLERSHASNLLNETEELLKKGELPCSNIHVIAGTPEAAGDFLINYAFIASSFPPKKSLVAEVLAYTPNSVFLCKGKKSRKKGTEA